ncbi:UL35 [anatid alphaherpesvirus 1]|nr:UL35 [Anatid alphaherpesvirus 1]WOC94982.1 UL35 [Anatid alphaherpesvirus 1]
MSNSGGSSCQATFDPRRPETYTYEALSAVPFFALLMELNSVSGHANVRQNTVSAARLALIRALSAGLTTIRRANDDATLGRYPMFGRTDGASWVRPSFGLKRTFSPRIIRDAPDDQR